MVKSWLVADIHSLSILLTGRSLHEVRINQNMTKDLGQSVYSEVSSKGVNNHRKNTYDYVLHSRFLLP